MNDMVQHNDRPRLAFFRSTGFIAVLLIVLVLAVQYGGAWYSMEVMKLSKEQELERHLKDLGALAQPLLGDPTELIVETVRELSEADEAQAVEMLSDPLMRSPFEQFAAMSRLRNLTLLDPGGRVLLSSAEGETPLTVYSWLGPDREPFESALAGEASGSVAYTADQAPLKRVYVPIAGDDGATAAVLALTAGRDYLSELARLGGVMRVVLTVSTLLALLIGWLVYRLLMQQRRWEQRAAHADRLRSLGSLAAGFAHEVRNPLEIINACTEDLEHGLRRREADDATLESCRDILEEVDRLNRLVSQFLQYARIDQNPADGGSAEARRTVGSAIAMVRHAAEKRGVAIRWRPPAYDGDDFVKMDENGLRQIVLNLLMNAIQASPGGGEAGVEMESRPREVTLRFIDAGPGVPKEIRARIFEPFFTTRDDGSGLGLAIAHQMAERAGGRLELEERPEGRGACFTLTLPRAADASPAPMRNFKPKPLLHEPVKGGDGS